MGVKTLSDKGLIHWDAAPFLKKVTDVAPGIIYIFNQHTQSNEYSNRSLGETLGYSAKEVLDMGAGLMPMLCHPDDLAKIGGHFELLKTLKNGDIARTEYRMRHKDGHWVWLMSHDTVFDRAADGSVLRHIGLASDITAQKEAEQRAINETYKATTTNDELLAFSYAMSHDMKAPSNTLGLLLSELLECHGDSLEPDAVELLDMALVTVQRMGLLIEDVLNYTRVIDHDLEIESVSLHQLIHEVLGDLQDVAAQTQAEIQVDALPDVRADAFQMRILFKNLIENAIKFHSPGSPARVRIYAPSSPDFKYCTVTIEDSGIGIDPAKHQQIFTIFKRLNAPVDFTGSGLGLAICRRIAANHSTQIMLRSELGEGSAFSIGLEPV